MLPDWLVVSMEGSVTFRGLWYDMPLASCPSLIALDIPNTLYGIGTDSLSCIARVRADRTALEIIRSSKKRRDDDVIYQFYYHALSHCNTTVAAAIREVCADLNDTFSDDIEAIDALYEGNLSLVDQVELCTDVALAVFPWHDHPALVRFLVNVARVDPIEVIDSVVAARHRLCSFELLENIDGLRQQPCLLQFVDRVPRVMPADIIASVWCASMNSNRDVTNAVLKWALGAVHKGSSVSTRSILAVGCDATDTEQWKTAFWSLSTEERGRVLLATQMSNDHQPPTAVQTASRTV